MPAPVAEHDDASGTAHSADLLTAGGPEVFFDPSVFPLLGGRVTVFQRFLTLLTQDVAQAHLEPARIEVRGTSDPEENTSQVLVRLWLGGRSEQEVREYYRAFGRRVDEWARHLSDDQRELFMTKISFQARRDADG